MKQTGATPATKSELLAVEKRLDEKIDSAGKRLEERIGSAEQRLDQKINRVAIELVKTNDRVGGMAEGLRTDMRQLNSDVAGKLDTFISRLEALWKESAFLPRVADEHGRRLDALEGRMTAVEAK